MPKRYKRLLITLAAIASLYLVKATGLDRDLIDEALNAAVEAFVEEQPAVEAPAEVELPADESEADEAEDEGAEFESEADEDQE